MIEYKEAIVRKLIFHKISNDEKRNYLSNNLFASNDEEELLLKKIFLKPFATNTTTYEFTHNIDLDLNPLYKLSKKIYEDGDFIDISKKIHQHLKSASKHPNIKDGDLFIVMYSDVKMNNVYYDALGIYKIENRERFIEIASNQLTFKKGIGLRKLDKACLILFTKSPYTLFSIDNGGIETDYWKNDFINVTYKKDKINSTGHFLKLTKEFVDKEMTREFKTSKADKADLLNKSIQFFKDHDSFNLNNFAKEVIKDPKAIESFKKYKTNFEEKKGFDVSEEFSISPECVKKEARTFKNIIKLDKNFQIIINGGREFIEQGEDTKGTFYKVYYREEK